MKKQNLLTKLLILLGVLIMNVSQVWAGITVTQNSHLDFYFDPSTTSANWKDHCALAFGNNSSSIKLPLTHISHTNLWYGYLNTNWGDIWWMAAYDADWGTGQAGAYSNYSNDIGAAWVSAQYSSEYTIYGNHITLVTIASGNNHPAITLTDVNANRNYDYMNYTINLESYVKTGTGDYEKANAKGAISATSYKIYGSHDQSTQTTASLSTSQNTTSIRCARTAETSFSVATPASGYEFVGWYDGNGSRISPDAEYTTYNPTTNDAYVRAYFAQTHTVTINPGVNGTVSVSGNKTIGQKGLSITASNTVDDYYFVGWVCTGGATVDDASAATTTIRATAAGTVTAKFVSKWAIRGSMSNDDWATYYDLTNKGSNTWSGKIRLSANSVYTFKVYDNPSGATWGYGGTDSYRRSYVGQTTAWGLASGEKELIIMTANEGDYTFSWNSSSKQLTVLYPEITHPNSNYVYFKNKPAGWSTVTAHIWGDGSVPSTGWDALPVLSTFSFDGDNYYYMALGSHTTGLVSDGSDGSDAKKTADLSLSSYKGQWYDIATKSAQSSEVSSRWHDFTQDVTLNLENGGSNQTIVATYGAAMPSKLKDGSTSVSVPSFSGYTFGGYYKNAGGSGTQYYTNTNNTCASAHVWDQTGASPSIYAKWTQSVPLDNENGESNGSVTLTYNSASHDAISNPTKTNYTFAGWYSGDDGSGQLIIDTEGALQANKTDGVAFTGAGGIWTHTGSAPTLHAKWNEIPYTVSVGVAVGGGGTTNVSSVTDAKVVTGSSTITAIPANEGWKFKEWQLGDGVSIKTGSTTTASITVNATKNSSITAVFEPRFALLGSENDGSSTASGTMPGWDPAGALPFTVNGFTALGAGEGKGVDFRCAVTLLPNRGYKFQVYDRTRNAIIGTPAASAQVTIAANASQQLNSIDTYEGGLENLNHDVLISTVGYGTYTFRITYLSNDGNLYPTVTIDRQSSYQSNFDTYYADGSGTLHQGTTGGTISVSSSQGGETYELTASGQWVCSGGSVTYTATPEPGYSFVGWYHSTAYNDRFSTSAEWTDGSLGATSNSYAKFVPKTLTFTGASDNSWSNTSNWTDSKIPTSDHDVIITSGKTATITAEAYAHDLTVKSGATLNVNTTNGDGTGSGITLTVNSLSLEGGWTEIDDEDVYDMPRVYIDKDSKITHTETTINFDIAVDNRNFYPIALPFPVTVSDVNYADTYLATYAKYGTAGQYVIKTYDGQFRANYGSVTGSWRVMRDGEREYESYSGEASEILKPGHGYILRAVKAKYGSYGDYAVIRFPMKNVDNKWTNGGENGHYTDATSEHIKDTVHVIAYKKAEGETPKANMGWNLLGVPYMSCYTTGAGMYDKVNVTSPATLLKGRFKYDTNTWEDGTIMYVTVPTHDFSEYIQANIADDDTLTTLLPGWCFFVQVAESGNLTFLTDSAAASSDLPIYAPKREKAMPTVKTGIILRSEEASDKTTLLVSDRYSAAEYEINADLEKMFGENSYTLATYSLSGDTRLAYNAMSKADAANIVPIGYRAPADGEYTFSINPRYAENGAFESVNLIDYETGDITDLLLYSYSFSTERTQNDERFALFVVPRQNTPTGLENGADGANSANGVRKMIINDKLYIIVDGKMYDAVGKMVK